MNEWPLHFLALGPLLLGAITYFLPRRAYHWCMGIGNLILTAGAVQLFIQVRWGDPIEQYLAGWPAGVAIALRADTVSMPLVVLTVLFFTCTYLFATRAGYMDKTFIFLFLLLEAAILGVLLSRDLFNIYVIMELGMICIAILIMYKQEQQSVYDGIVYIMMNFIGMAFMLLGIAYLYRITGVLDLQLIHERLMDLEDPRVAIIPYALIMTAIAMKAALWPLFSWLPRAHGAPSAPAIVSAVLSGVQVKVGVYLLIRLNMVFEPVMDAREFFLIVGLITSTVGFLLAVVQNDIKLILAYSTISQVGLIVAGLHLGTPEAYWGSMYHIINHALFKGLLFLTAGVIIEAYKTRSCSDIRGVLRRMPFMGAVSLVAILGIIGTPFFNGSISKYFISVGAVDNPAEIAFYLINFGTMLCFIKYATILFGQPPDPVSYQRDPFIGGVSLVFSLAILAGGLLGGPTIALLYGAEYATRGALGANKILLFLATLSAALVVYRWIIFRWDEKCSIIRSFKPNFNQITGLITFFFAALFAYSIYVHAGWAPEETEKDLELETTPAHVIICPHCAREIHLCAEQEHQHQ